jgi:hypothetical protein
LISIKPDAHKFADLSSITWSCRTASANCPIPTPKFAQSKYTNQDWLKRSSLSAL